MIFISENLFLSYKEDPTQEEDREIPAAKKHDKGDDCLTAVPYAIKETTTVSNQVQNTVDFSLKLNFTSIGS